MGEDDPYAVLSLQKLFDALTWIPSAGSTMYEKIVSSLLATSGETVRTGLSHKVLAHPRLVRFKEMEYTVPADAGIDCLRKVLQRIKDKSLPVCFPLEFRYVKSDDSYLSMFEGMDGCSISVHQMGDREYKNLFAEIEPIFWEFDGRPHLGKIHTLDGNSLSKLYSRHWKDFQEIRLTLDPDSKLMNPHLQRLFQG